MELGAVGAHHTVRRPHPAKFPETVFEATGVAPPVPLAARALAQLPERFDRLPAQPEAVKAYVRAFVAA